MKTVANRAPELEARVEDWAMMRAFVAGRDAVMEGEKYIQKLPGHTSDTFKMFKGRAYFLNATQRSIDGLVGLLFRKEPQSDWPKGFQGYADDVTRDGRSARQLAEEIAQEVLTVGYCGVLVDHPQEREGLLTTAGMEQMGIRPYARLYTAESVLGVKETTRGADRILKQVRLKEAARVADPDDEFGEIEVSRVRVLELDDAGVYFVRLFEKQTDAKGKEKWVEIAAFYPKKRGQPITEIPFRFFTRRGSHSVPPKPPLLDLAESNKGHVNDSALYQWGLMWTANPTPCFVNLTLAEGETVNLGASKGLQFGEGGNAFFLEFGGAGLAAIRQAMEDKRRDMAVLGARMLTEERRQVEAAETAQIHRSGENSVLSAIANAISEGMEWVLGWVGSWAGIEVEISYRVNTDFVAVPMDAQRLTALMGAWQGGGITRADLFGALQRGEIIRDDKTYDQHEGELETEPAPLASVAAE
jgi:hypothetical protein